MQKKILYVVACIFCQIESGATDVTSLKLSFSPSEAECSYEIRTAHNAEAQMRPLEGFDPVTDILSLDDGRIAIQRSVLGLGTTFTIKNLDIFPTCEQVTISKMESSPTERTNVILNGHGAERVWPISKLRLSLESITIGTGPSDREGNDFLIGSIEVLDRDIVSLAINGHGKIAGRVYESGNWLIARDGTIMPFSIANISRVLGAKGMPRNEQELKEILDAVWDPSDGIGNSAFERWIGPLPGRKADTAYIQKDKLTATLNELVWKIVPSSSQVAKSFTANNGVLLKNWTFPSDPEPRTNYAKVEEIIAVVQNLKKLYNSVNRLKVGGVIPSWVYSLNVNQNGDFDVSETLFKLDPSVMQLMPTKDEKQGKIDILQNKVNDLEGQLQRHKNQIENEKARNRNLEQQLQAVDQIKEKVDAFAKEKGRQELEIKTAKEENIKLQKLIQDLKQENEQLNLKLLTQKDKGSSESALVANLAELRVKLAESEKNIVVLQEIEKQKISLEREKLDLEKKVSSLEKDLQVSEMLRKHESEKNTAIFNVTETALQGETARANEAAKAAKADLVAAKAQIEKLAEERTRYQTFFGMHAVDLAGRSKDIREVADALRPYAKLYQAGTSRTFQRYGTFQLQGASVEISNLVKKLDESLAEMIQFNGQLYQTFKPFYRGDHVHTLQELKALPESN